MNGRRITAEGGATHSSCKFYIGGECTNPKSRNFRRRLPPNEPSCPQFEPRGGIASDQSVGKTILWAVFAGIGLGIGFLIVNKIGKKLEKKHG